MTWRTVQPPSRYGVLSCSSFNPATAARNFAGASAISAIHCFRCSGVLGAWNEKGPIGNFRSFIGDAINLLILILEFVQLAIDAVAQRQQLLVRAAFAQLSF